MTENDSSESGSNQDWWGRCPNCGEVSSDGYETGRPDIREFDCFNENCRVCVFRAKENTETEPGDQA